MINVIKQNKITYLIIALSLVCIAIGAVLSTLFSLLAFLIVAVAIIFLRPGDAYSILFAILPFANIFKMSAGSVSFFTILEMLAVVMFFIKCKKVRLTPLLSMIALLVYMMVFAINNLEVLTIVKVMAGFLLMYCARFHIKKENVVNIAYGLSISVAAMLVLCQIPSYFAHIEEYLEEMNYLINATGYPSTILRNSGFLGDPNYCAVMIMISLALLCVLYYYKDIGVEFWAISAVLIPLGFLTYSKSYFLCVVAFAIILLLLVLFPKHKVFAIIAIVGIVIFAYYVVNGQIQVVNLILDRFSGSVSDITTGRTSLNYEYITYIRNNIKVLLFGEGITVETYPGAKNTVHNIYIELFFKMGLFGSMLYLFTLFTIFKGKKKSTKLLLKKRKMVDFVPLLFVIIMFAFLAGVLNYSTPFYLIIAYVSIKYTALPNYKENKLVSNIQVGGFA